MAQTVKETKSLTHYFTKENAANTKQIVCDPKQRKNE